MAAAFACEKVAEEVREQFSIKLFWVLFKWMGFDYLNWMVPFSPITRIMGYYNYI